MLLLPLKTAIKSVAHPRGSITILCQSSRFLNALRSKYTCTVWKYSIRQKKRELPGMKLEGIPLSVLGGLPAGRFSKTCPSQLAFYRRFMSYLLHIQFFSKQHHYFVVSLTLISVRFKTYSAYGMLHVCN